MEKNDKNTGSMEENWHKTEANYFSKKLCNFEDNSGSSECCSTSFVEDDEFHYLKGEKVQRSRSLKTYKTPPGTPHQKKVVRFADALGLDLEDVRTIMNKDSPPSIPASAIEPLIKGLEEEQNGNKYIVVCFEQPGTSVNFLNRVHYQKICLESVQVEDQTVCGLVRVANIAFHKIVMVRYTSNEWLNNTDVFASYVLKSCDGKTDKFSFTLSIPDSFSIGERLQFALCYRVEGAEYWDNNGGNNYVLECFAPSFPTLDSDRTYIHFL